MSYYILLEKRHPGEMLQKEVSIFLNLDLNLMEYLYDDGPGGVVNIDVNYLNGDFSTNLSVHKKDDFASDLKQIDFALYLSKRLNENILLSYWTNNPFLWILVEPDGCIYKVQEIPSERDQFIEIDFYSKERLTREEVRTQKSE